MRRALSSLSLLLFFGFAGDAAAQMGPGSGCLAAPPKPDKRIRIVNNSNERIFPMLQIPIYDPTPHAGVTPSADLWMQAQCNIPTGSEGTRRFNTTLLYRAWINHPAGIPPNGGTVTITVPFYTRLKANITAPPLGNLGTVPDQFIDWWNSARIYFFYGNVARTSAFLDGGGHRPKPLDLGNFPHKPTCSMPNQPTCPITFQTSEINARDNIAFQLQEYTFAAAEGPPNRPAGFQIDLSIVNYNVSSLDSVYLPLAMGPMQGPGQDPTKTPWVGDGDSVEVFNAKINTFTNNGTGWPFYIPAYFANAPLDKAANWPPIVEPAPGETLPSCAFIQPFIPDANPPLKDYLFPKIPGTYNLLIESFRRTRLNDGRFATASPPLLSSQPANFRTVQDYNTFKCRARSGPFVTTPALGTRGQAVIALWNRCLGSNMDTSDTCVNLRAVKDFFLANYNQTCSSGPTPGAIEIMSAVYGWVPITAPQFPNAGDNTCTGGALKTTQANLTYQQVFAKFCDLQYNYLTPGRPQADVFNPYTQFIHGTGPNELGSTAYAFSVDDGVSFRALPAPGVIIAIGGTSGLDFPAKTPPPNFLTYQLNCNPNK